LTLSTKTDKQQHDMGSILRRYAPRRDYKGCSLDYRSIRPRTRRYGDQNARKGTGV
jgi:hypothetical protein